jgi:hypothetical protein
MASLRLVQDVEIAQLDSHQAVVVAHGPLPCGERLLLEVPVERNATPRTLLVRVFDNRVVIADGSLRRRVHLEIVQRETGDRAVEGLEIGQGRPIMAALIRRIPVRIVEASTRGCLIESPSMIVEGSVGFLRMRTSTHDHSEAVRVRRTSQTSNLVWQYRMAAEFLTLGVTSPDSLRGLATIITSGSPVATYL